MSAYPIPSVRPPTVPVVSPAQVGQGIADLKIVRAASSHVTESLETFIPSMNAFASISVPADPAVLASTLAIPHVAAGDLERPTVTPHSDPYGMEMIRVYRDPILLPLYFGVEGEHEGLSFFHELDLQADALSPGDTFADLPGIQQLSLIASIAAGTATPIDPLTGTPAALQALFVIANYVAQVPYFGNNWPEGAFRKTLMQTGKGPVNLTDVPNQITAPNNRAPSQGGTATFATAWDYLGYPFPSRAAVEQMQYDAFVDWMDAGSNAAYAAYVAGLANGSIMAVGT